MVAFWDNVDKTDSCWLWKGPKTNNGYGVSARFERTIVAHRRAYLELVGPIPEGMQLDHLCRVRHCVNPAHLEPVSPSENWHRSNAHQVWQTYAAQTHCKRGHEFTPENTYIRPSRSNRECRICKRASAQAKAA